jgi:Secretion system C-terminal sorting domain
MKKKIGCFLVILCCCGVSRAQQVVSSGGYVVKSDVTVNWILGGSLSDILSYDRSTPDNSLIQQLTESEISLKVYPNPATDFINIEISPADTGRLILELYNNSGVKVLSKPTVYQPVMQVIVGDVPSGIYYLKVFQPFSRVQLYKAEKIIKK